MILANSSKFVFFLSKWDALKPRITILGPGMGPTPQY